MTQPGCSTASIEVEQELQPFVEGQDARSVRAHVAAHRHAGVRGAAVGLGDVDLEDSVIHIRPNQTPTAPQEQKSRRDVAIWPQLKEVLTPYLQTKPDPKALLFATTGGKPLRT